MLNLTRLSLCVLALSLLTVCAQGQPLTWYVQGVTFDDDGTASGSFNYDATTNQYSQINIVTTTGSSRTGATYLILSNGFVPDATGVLFNTVTGNQTGLPGLALFFVPIAGAPPGPLTVYGGTIDLGITGGQEASCADLSCISPAPPSRFLTKGIVGSSETLETYFFFGG